MWKLKPREGQKLPKAAEHEVWAGAAPGTVDSQLGLFLTFPASPYFWIQRQSCQMWPDSSVVMFILIRITLTMSDRKFKIAAAYCPPKKVQGWAVWD